MWPTTVDGYKPDKHRVYSSTFHSIPTNPTKTMNVQTAAAKLLATFKGVGHTNVVTTLYTTTLYHYETAIVTIDSTSVEINNGGFKSATTKKFINRALQSIGFNGYLSQRKFALYLTVSGVERPFIGSQVCLTA